MRLTLLIAAIMLALAIAWGVVAGSQPAPPRAQDMTIAVTPDWYDALPRDPAAAAQAYFARVPQEMRDRGEAVSNSRYFVFTARVMLTIAAGLLILFSGAAAALRDVAQRFTKSRALQDAFVALAFLTLMMVITLPVDVYAGYVRRRAFGFSDLPFGDWFTEYLGGWAIFQVFYVIGAVAIFALIRRAPRTWPALALAVYVALVATYATLSPVYFEPIFNRVTPLAEGPQREAILSLARANEVPAHEVYVQDASRQTRLLNAHVSGAFGTTRIVLDDNLLNHPFKPGVDWVMAHEMGHYVLGHVGQFIILDGLIMALGFGLIAWALGTLIARYGPRWRITGAGDSAALPLFWLLFLVFGFLAAPVNGALSTVRERQADLFGLNASQAPHGMAEFAIHDADAQRLHPTALDKFLFYDHPSNEDRVNMAMRWRAERMGRAEAVDR